MIRYKYTKHLMISFVILAFTFGYVINDLVYTYNIACGALL